MSRAVGSEDKGLEQICSTRNAEPTNHIPARGMRLKSHRGPFFDCFFAFGPLRLSIDVPGSSARYRHASTRHIGSLHAVAGFSIDCRPEVHSKRGHRTQIRHQTSAAPELPLPTSKIGCERGSCEYRSLREGDPMLT